MERKGPAAHAAGPSCIKASAIRIVFPQLPQKARISTANNVFSPLAFTREEEHLTNQRKSDLPDGESKQGRLEAW